MDFNQFRVKVSSISVGKKLPDAVYIHKDALSSLNIDLVNEIKRVSSLYAEEFTWNIVKLFKRDHRVSFLNYPQFFDESFPTLHSSLTVDLVRNTARKTSYAKSENPPILHRKEAFLPVHHPHFDVARKITLEAEELGLFDNPKKIGFRKYWEQLIADKGYGLVTGRLVKLAELSSDAIPNIEVNIKRHRTAINRGSLSAPMQGLARHGYLDGDFSVFDYGCGKGDDILELEAHGIDVTGWDPVFRSEGLKKAADIVNLGFVINVIEERTERIEVLQEAYGLATKLLVVSAMLGRDSKSNHFKPYKDGVITSRDTFQKYFSQAELKKFLEASVNAQAFAVAPGVFFVFTDSLAEQTFLSNRQRVQRTWRQITRRDAITRNVDFGRLVEKNKELVGGFWNCCLNLGRLPANDEYEGSSELRRKFGSHRKAFEALEVFYDNEEYLLAREGRVEDVVVYFALSFFRTREAYKKMPLSLQRDIKSFFGTQAVALEVAKKSLFSIAKVEAITEACLFAREELQEGRLEDDHSYVVHRSVVNSLPGILRIYVGCAAELYGDLDSVDLVKIHMTSGKVSLMIYDDFSRRLPILKERIKIKMREQSIDWFDYDDVDVKQPLYLKSAYMNETYSDFQSQQEFDRCMLSLPGIDLSGYGPSYQELKSIVSANGGDFEAFIPFD